MSKNHALNISIADRAVDDASRARWVATEIRKSIDLRLDKSAVFGLSGGPQLRLPIEQILGPNWAQRLDEIVEIYETELAKAREHLRATIVGAGMELAK